MHTSYIVLVISEVALVTSECKLTLLLLFFINWTLLSCFNLLCFSLFKPTFLKPTSTLLCCLCLPVRWERLLWTGPLLCCAAVTFQLAYSHNSQLTFMQILLGSCPVCWVHKSSTFPPNVGTRAFISRVPFLPRPLCLAHFFSILLFQLLIDCVSSSSKYTYYTSTNDMFKAHGVATLAGIPSSYDLYEIKWPHLFPLTGFLLLLLGLSGSFCFALLALLLAGLHSVCPHITTPSSQLLNDSITQPMLCCQHCCPCAWSTSASNSKLHLSGRRLLKYQVFKQ